MNSTTHVRNKGDGAQEMTQEWMQASENLFQRTVELSQEISRFAQQRLQDEMNTLQALLTCRSPLEAMESQRQFLLRMNTQYVEEAGRLGGIIWGMAAEGGATATARRGAAE